MAKIDTQHIKGQFYTAMKMCTEPMLTACLTAVSASDRVNAVKRAAAAV